MKYVLKALAVSMLLIGIASVLPTETQPQPTQAQQQSNPCPEGSYNIGTKDGTNPICKLEPTGCPYGDSIPMDMCDKFKPAEQVQEQPKPAQPQAAQCGGK